MSSPGQTPKAARPACSIQPMNRLVSAPSCHFLPNKNAGNEDDTLRSIVERDGEGKWKEKSEELNAAMASHYKAMTLTAVAKGKRPVEHGRVAAQCLHRYVAIIAWFLCFAFVFMVVAVFVFVLVFVAALELGGFVSIYRAAISHDRASQTFLFRFIIHRMLRWKKVLQPGLNKGHWSPEEDEIIRREVASAEVTGRVSVLSSNAIACWRETDITRQIRSEWDAHP